VEADAAKIRKRLLSEGWTLLRHGGAHHVYVHPAKPLPVQLPRHRVLSPDVARSIAKAAGWL
jgi:predicted RNA binding protein YcfA (HicA-like mRNA interferase family)